MSQVIIVSNRLPISVKRENGKLVYTPSLGGLATGLSSYVDDPTNTWIGWPGIASDELSEHDKQSISEELAKHNCHPVFLTQKQINEYYNGYCNSVLWPLFHNLPARRTNKDLLPISWRAYQKVNRHFSDVIISLAQPTSQIWVHDYQLLLLPELLRSEKSIKSVGFFLHIPFPDPKTLSKLSEGKKLLKGILGADLIGFHTTGYVENFMAYCAMMGFEMADGNLIVLPSHTALVREFPMGIDYEKFASAGETKEVKLAVKRYKKRYLGLKLIVSVDRLDPTKGLLERLHAYATFLKLNPEQHGKVVFVMVAAPSRTDIAVYKKLAQRLTALAKEVNKTYGTPTWQPVDYVNVSQSFEEVAALFQIANIAFIVPLRDGMNLAAKEFVASNKRQGVLILSQTAGAAEELRDALIVNPKRPESLVEALQQAMAMQESELQGRLSRMQQDLSVNTVQYWAKTFVDTLQRPIPYTPHLTWTLNNLSLRNLYRDFRKAPKRLLLLDYDGTLVPFSKHYKDAKPPKAILDLLEKLSNDPTNEIVLISGRSSANLEKWFAKIRMSLVAEHGMAFKQAGTQDWQTIDASSTQWKQTLQPTLEKYAKLVPGAHVEVKPNSLAWHYREAKSYNAEKYAVIMKRSLKPSLRMFGLEILQGNKVLEIKAANVSKANAARQWLDRNYQFVLAIGDDQTDEGLFLSLPDDGYSIKVGRGHSAARFRLASSKEAVSLLRKLAKL